MAAENELKTDYPARAIAAATSGTLLSVEGLTVAYGHQTVVHDVGFTLERGQSLALIGESGSGKSTIARTVLRLLPPQARILGGRSRSKAGTCWAWLSASSGRCAGASSASCPRTRATR